MIPNIDKIIQCGFNGPLREIFKFFTLTEIEQFLLVSSRLYGETCDYLIHNAKDLMTSINDGKTVIYSLIWFKICLASPYIKRISIESNLEINTRTFDIFMANIYHEKLYPGIGQFEMYELLDKPEVYEVLFSNEKYYDLYKKISNYTQFENSYKLKPHERYFAGKSYNYYDTNKFLELYYDLVSIAINNMGLKFLNYMMNMGIMVKYGILKCCIMLNNVNSLTIYKEIKNKYIKVEHSFHIELFRQSIYSENVQIMNSLLDDYNIHVDSYFSEVIEYMVINTEMEFLNIFFNRPKISLSEEIKKTIKKTSPYVYRKYLMN